MGEAFNSVSQEVLDRDGCEANEDGGGRVRPRNGDEDQRVTEVRHRKCPQHVRGHCERSGLIHSAGKLLHTSKRISTSMTTVLLSK